MTYQELCLALRDLYDDTGILRGDRIVNLPVMVCLDDGTQREVGSVETELGDVSVLIRLREKP